MIPKALKARKNMAATLVQRYVRGYIDFTNIRTIINQKKLKENLEYFGKIKFTLESNAQVKIRYYWKKYKKAKKKRLDEARKKKKKEADKKKKKGGKKSGGKSPAKLVRKTSAAPTMGATKSDNPKLAKRDSHSPSKTLRSAASDVYSDMRSELSSPGNLPMNEEGLGEDEMEQRLEGIEEEEEEKAVDEEEKRLGDRRFSIELQPAEAKKPRSRGFIETVAEEDKLEPEEERKAARPASSRAVHDFEPLSGAGGGGDGSKGDEKKEDDEKAGGEGEDPGEEKEAKGEDDLEREAEEGQEEEGE